MQSFKQLTVQTMLEGAFDDSYTSPNNSSVVATDTVKNLIYIIAKDHPLDTTEVFAQDVAKFFLKEYSHVTRINLEIVEHLWRRLEVAGKPHDHSFEKASNEVRTVKLSATRSSPPQIESGIRDLIVLKTTRSGFVGFYKDKYTVLPEIADRMFGTSVQATWKYTPDVANRNYSAIDFNSTWNQVRETFVQTFCEEYSPSVQKTMYSAAEKVLKQIPHIDEITFLLPNIHNWNFDFAKFGMTPSTDLFIPVDEPHGLICCTVRRLCARL